MSISIPFIADMSDISMHLLQSTDGEGTAQTYCGLTLPLLDPLHPPLDDGDFEDPYYCGDCMEEADRG